MKRRDFIKNTLLTSAGFLAACNANRPATGNNKMKVVLIGLDGANWPTMDPLMAQGKLPFFKTLKEQSAWGYLDTFKPTKSSVVWTSIATGKNMEKHGILDFTFMDKNNIQVPFSNVERREPAIWQILDEYNKRSIVCNWFVSHPPDDFNGIMASDNFRRVVARPPDKLDEYKDSVKPSIYFHKLLKHAERDYRIVFQKSGLPDYPQIYTDLHPNEDFKKVPILKTFRSMAVQDYFVTNYSKELYYTKDFDLFATYIRMPDLVQHFSARLFDDAYTKQLVEKLQNDTMTPEEKNSTILKIATILEPVYIFCEDLVKSLVDYKKYEDAYFIICSDHGFSLYPGGYNHYDLPEGFPPPPGILMMKGPQVVPGEIKGANVYDIAPTILSLFDKPVGKHMDGKALTSAFKLNRKRQYKVYRLKQSNRKREGKVDKDTMDELKSIGYVN